MDEEKPVRRGVRVGWEKSVWLGWSGTAQVSVKCMSRGRSRCCVSLHTGFLPQLPAASSELPEYVLPMLQALDFPTACPMLPVPPCSLQQMCLRC